MNVKEIIEQVRSLPLDNVEKRVMWLRSFKQSNSRFADEIFAPSAVLARMQG